MAKGTARRDLKKEAFWRRTVRRQARSGMSIRAWCRDQRVQEASFHWWRRELARRDAEHAGVGRAGVADRVGHLGPALFLPVRVTENDPADEGSRIEIVLTDGQRVRVHGSVDQQVLADVLDVLEHRAC